MIKEFPSLTRLMDEGLKNDIKEDFKHWNERTAPEGEERRYPLSPSTIGRCSLKLARDLSHYHGVESFPRSEDSREPRLQRIFRRGDTLELALVQDFNEKTPCEITHQQHQLELFTLTHPKGDRKIVGNIDGIAVDKARGVSILLDFKSKGAFYSAYGNSVDEMIAKLTASGHGSRLEHNTFLINNAEGFFDSWPLDDMLLWYVLQLNAYGVAMRKDAAGAKADSRHVDFVALYYENKNTCEQVEIRWEPSDKLFEFARGKFQYVYTMVMDGKLKEVEREFVAGSSQCRLCEYNNLCNPAPVKETPTLPPTRGSLPKLLDKDFSGLVNLELSMKRTQNDVLVYMEKAGLTKVTLSNGITYERKFLKSPKPHWALRVSK